MTHIGTCTMCRWARRRVHPCKVEAFAGDAHPVEALLCEQCRKSITRAVVTVLTTEEAPSDVTVMYQ